jgi:hypothetical protein
MSDSTLSVAKRAVQAAAFTIGGGVALAFAMAGSAHADTISGQSATVVNSGVGVANSGGNVAVGNDSTNVAGCAQGAAGFVANNSCDAGGSSNGTASITTGNATAVGNQSTTNVSQHVAGDDDPGSLTVAGQAAPVVNAGVGVANSGLNGAVGNDSTNIAGCAQGAAGVIANNSCNAGGSSNGSASIHTGNATGLGNVSSTTIDQGVSGGDGPGGLTVVGQFAPVVNAGVGLANTGLNGAVGNDSFNLNGCLQGAFGVIANNTCQAGGSSNGTANIVTGNATGIGNTSSTTIGQSVATDPSGLAIVGQVAPVINAGIGLANSGLNFAEGNDSLEAEIIAQVSFGLLANNIALPGGWSDGFAMVVSGNATGIGNQSATNTQQHA